MYGREGYIAMSNHLKVIQSMITKEVVKVIFYQNYKSNFHAGMVGYAFNPGTPVAEEGRSLGLPGQPGLFSEFQASQLHGEIVSQTPNEKRAACVG